MPKGAYALAAVFACHVAWHKEASPSQYHGEERFLFQWSNVAMTFKGA